MTDWNEVSSLSDFIEAFPGAVVMLTADSNASILNANSNAIELYGCVNFADFKAFTGGNTRGLVHPLDINNVNDDLISQLKKDNEKIVYTEYRILRKDGRVRLVSEYGRIINSNVYGSVYLAFIFDDSQHLTRVLKVMEPHFFKIVKTNLDTDRYVVIKDEPHDIASPAKKHSQLLTNFAHSGFVHPDDVKYFLNKLSKENLRSYFTSGNNNMLIRYRRRFGEDFKWVTMIVSRAEEYTDSNIALTFFLRLADDDFLEKNETAHRNEVVSGLSFGYDSIYILDTENVAVTAYRLSTKLAKVVDAKISSQYADYIAANNAYAKAFVCLEDREKYLLQTSVDYIQRMLLRVPRYDVIFRQYRDKDTLEHIQLNISAMDYLDKTHVILAYKNVSEQVNEARIKMAESRTDEILRAVATDFVFLLEIDLATEKEKHYFVYKERSLEIPEWSDSDDFRQCVLDYVNKFVASYDKERFKAETNLDNMVKRLESENYFTLTYDVIIRGKARRFQGRFVLQKNDYSSSKIFISTRDISPKNS